MGNKQHIIAFDIPSGMYRSVEWNDGTSSPASRQGCILNRMQERGILCIFYRAIFPDGNAHPRHCGYDPQPERSGARRSQSPEFEEMLKQEILKQVQDDVESF
jgi:hypothetical protein